ncbi:MAG: FeoB-associated Cys-rich membrane protein [Clostridia bacterium]|nr:FeoB-associated Cys-rich membrane protein [Clostridia bacterium]
MISWIINNLSTIIISLILLSVVSVIVAKLLKDKKRGKSACSYTCGCASCPMSASCHK